jgi:putative hydrolase of the HAD superfamily
MSRIESVVFDVGWVLVHLDYNPFLNYLATSGQRYDIKEVIAAIDLEAHERGELGGDQLLDNMIQLAPHLDRGQLRQLWTSMFTPVEPMFELARKLSQSHRVHLLSNVGDLHWTYLDRQYQLLSVAHSALPSFEARVMKPHRDIYKLAEQRFDLNPATTVFIDDLPPNVESARQCGWRAVQHVSPESTISTLKDMGVY